MPSDDQRLHAPITDYARADFTTLDERLNLGEALDQIRRTGIGERIIYFYVTNADGKLVGVLPTRRLLTAPAEQPLAQVMVRRVAAIPQTATLLEACDLFVLYKFLSFPVVDENRRIVGVVDASLLTEELLNAGDIPVPVAPARTTASLSAPLPEPLRAARSSSAPPVALSLPPNEIFELLGFHLAQVREGTSPWRVFRLRFPWLLATIASGTLCALLSGLFAATLAKSLVLAFFMTMVLALNESLSIQAMSVTIQALRGVSLSWRWFFRTLRRELASALLLAAGLRRNGGPGRPHLAARRVGGGGHRGQHHAFAADVDGLWPGGCRPCCTPSSSTPRSPPVPSPSRWRISVRWDFISPSRGRCCEASDPAKSLGPIRGA